VIRLWDHMLDRALDGDGSLELPWAYARSLGSAVGPHDLSVSRAPGVDRPGEEEASRALGQ
jgi:hypothetical protein